MLATIADRRVRRLIARRIDTLATGPELQGKALVGELAGLRSVRAAGQRYCVVFRVDREQVVVVVVAVGLRREGSSQNIYELAKKLVRLRLLGP